MQDPLSDNESHRVHKPRDKRCPIQVFECPNCGKTLDTGSELQSHIEIEHTQVSSLTLCSKVSSEYVKNLVDETDNFESDYESYEEKEDLECSKCNFATYNQTDMDNHKKEKH